MLSNDFFNRDTIVVAKELLGKILNVRYEDIWLKVKIIETEAYYLNEKASHASLGYTEKRKALFMPSGTIYMYYARGKDSLNISCRGDGNAVLIKSGFPFMDKNDDYEKMLILMNKLNPMACGSSRKKEKLCCGQTLLCSSLNLKVGKWDKKTFNKEEFYIQDIGYYPKKIIQAQRLGIPKGRDEHLLYRFVDEKYARYCTKNPLKGGYSRKKELVLVQ